MEMDRIFGFFDFGLMISIIVLTFGLFKVMKSLKIKCCTNVKRFITLIFSLILSIIYYFTIDFHLEKIIPTYLVSVVFYDYIILYVVDKIENILKSKLEKK